jgi:ferredoxin
MRSTDGGFSNEPHVMPDRCNGCGACEAVCPTGPIRAIRVAPSHPAEKDLRFERTSGS